jgi:CheY-like chemotaxis protein
LINATRFTPRGGKIVITAERVQGSVRIRVIDTGAGISAEHLAHLFDRFWQADSSLTRTQGGLGLGLSIVRHLIEAHGGSVEARSEGLGHGATFTLQLPIVETVIEDAPSAKDVVPAERPSDASSASTRARLANVRALVVDDDPDSLELIRTVLESAGATVSTASSAADALVAIGPFDVMVSDIGMPGVDGYSLLRRIRSGATYPDVPAIALTAYARKQDVALAESAGYQQHVPKPVNSEDLVEVVRKWARSRS